MRRIILALCVLLFVGSANATVACVPSQIGGSGSNAAFFETDTAQGWVGWCPTSDATGWFVTSWSACSKSIPGDCTLSWSQIEAALRRVLAASDMVAQFNTEAAAIISPPAAGSYQDYVLRRWKWDACNALNGTAPPTAIPAGVTPDTSACGTAPTAVANSGSTGDKYVVTGSTAYYLNADGTRSIRVAPVKPTAGATCDCTTPILSLGARYCAVSLAGITQPVVAGCSLSR